MSPIALFVVILAFAGSVVLFLTRGIQKPKKKTKIQIPPAFEDLAKKLVPGSSSIFNPDHNLSYSEPVKIEDLKTTANFEDSVLKVVVAGKAKKKEPVKKTPVKKKAAKEAKKSKETKVVKKTKKEASKKPGRPKKDKGDTLLLS